MHGKVWMFSHLIDDEDIEFMQHEFISYRQAMDYYNLGYKPKVSECRENQTKRRKRRDTENQISKKKGGYELMSKVTFEEDELAVVALFQENTRKDTIDILKDTLEALEETKEDPLEDDLLETIASAISKLQMIEDKYYYSLDLNRYLNNLEDDAYEE